MRAEWTQLERQAEVEGQLQDNLSGAGIDELRNYVVEWLRGNTLPK